MTIDLIKTTSSLVINSFHHFILIKFCVVKIRKEWQIWMYDACFEQYMFSLMLLLLKILNFSSYDFELELFIRIM